MLENDPDLDKSISNAKEAAKERQPIRADVYLNHMKYRESQIEQLKRIIKQLKDKDPETPRINFNLKTPTIPDQNTISSMISLHNEMLKCNRYYPKYPDSGLGSEK